MGQYVRSEWIERINRNGLQFNAPHRLNHEFLRAPLTPHMVFDEASKLSGISLC